MMDSIRLFTISYILLVTMFNLALLVNGESRVDAYLCLNILSYYISFALFMKGVTRSMAQRIINILFIIIFIIIVIYRVYMVIQG